MACSKCKIPFKHVASGKTNRKKCKLCGNP